MDLTTDGKQTTDGGYMAERKVTVRAQEGLHARPAALFVQAASKAAVPVTIAKPGRDAVNARSILAVLGLDVRCGEEVILSAEGEGADDALGALEALLSEAEPGPGDVPSGGPADGPSDGLSDGPSDGQGGPPDA
jgi:phosphocarrier protein HPr